jgi:cell division protein FtsB
MIADPACRSYNKRTKRRQIGKAGVMEAITRSVRPINSGRILMRILVGLLLVFALASATAIYFKQEAQFLRIRQREAILADAFSEASAALAELRELQSIVDTDAYIERVARDQLGMVRPNEVVFANP